MNNVEIPSYAEGLKELRDTLGQMLPAETLAIFDKDALDLNEMSSILKVNVGEQAPDFTLSNAIGESVSLSNELKSSNVLLVFYRGTWCPYCNLALSQYQKMLSQIEGSNTKLIAVSPQTPDESLNMKEKNQLGFEVLSDNGNLVARLYTSVFQVDEKIRFEMKNLGIDFTSFYSDDSSEIPVPAVFVIDRNGVVQNAQTEGGDFRNRTEGNEIIQQLKKLQS